MMLTTGAMHFVYAYVFLATRSLWTAVSMHALGYKLLHQVFGTGGPALLERGRFDVATMQALRQRGHSVLETELTSGLQAIRRTPQGWSGGADPRREGAVRGD